MVESIDAVMAGLVPAIHAVQLEKWKRFAAISPWRATQSTIS